MNVLASANEADKGCGVVDEKDIICNSFAFGGLGH